MKKKFKYAKSIALSSTAKDTYVLFSGNIFASFFSFIFTTITARLLTVEEFGVVSAIINFVIISVSISNLGVSAGITNFIPQAIKKGNKKLANEYIKAAFIIRLFSVSIITLLLLLLTPGMMDKIFLTREKVIIPLTSLIIVSSFLWHFTPVVLMAKRKYIKSTIADAGVAFTRPIVLILFMFIGLTSINWVLFANGISAFISSLILGYFLLGFGFLKANIKRKTVVKLMRFSGWLSVNQIMTSISSRLDVQMIAALGGVTVTGYYSIAARLSFFISLLFTSFMGVISPRLAAYTNKEEELKYIKKAVIGITPIILGIIFWIIIARPFIILLFGEKYAPSVTIFRAVAASYIPLLLATPAYSAVMFSIKKPKLIGVFSIIQLIITFILNWLLIPMYGPYGPAITFGISYTILAVYVWGIVWKEYK